MEGGGGRGRTSLNLQPGLLFLSWGLERPPGAARKSCSGACCEVGMEAAAWTGKGDGGGGC